MKKKLLALVCVLSTMLMFTACGETEYTDFEAYKMSFCEDLTSCNLEVVSGVDADDVSTLTSMYNKEEMKELYASTFYSAYSYEAEAELGAFDGFLTTYVQMESDMGSINGYGEYTSEISGDEIIVTVPVDGVNCDGTITFTYSNDIFYRLQEVDCTADTTFAQKMSAAGSSMGTAGMNTLLGMGSVFVILILISLIISAFGPIFGKSSKKKAEVKAENKQPEVKVEDLEGVELSDDTELVAVIAAAIAAYEGASSTDGFVVRSIKKANRRI